MEGGCPLQGFLITSVWQEAWLSADNQRIIKIPAHEDVITVNEVITCLSSMNVFGGGVVPKQRSVPGITPWPGGPCKLRLVSTNLRNLDRS